MAILFVDRFKEVYFKNMKYSKNIFYVLLYYYIILLLVKFSKCRISDKNACIFLQYGYLLLYHLRHLQVKNYLLKYSWSSTPDKIIIYNKTEMMTKRSLIGSSSKVFIN